jgi:hypothetical protein
MPHYTAIVTLLAVLLYFYTGIEVAIQAFAARAGRPCRSRRVSPR